MPSLGIKTKQNLSKSEFENDKVNELMLYYQKDIERFPLNFEDIQRAQQANAEVVMQLNDPDYHAEEFDGFQLICKTNEGTPKIVLPDAMMPTTIKWYHYVCGHGGID